MFPSCRITSSGAGVSQDRSSAAEGGRSKFRLDLPSSIFFQEVCGQANHFSLSLSLFLSFKQPVGVNEEVVTSDRSPPVMTASLKYLWEIVDHGNGNIWREIYENFLSDENFCNLSWKFVKIIFFFRWSLEKQKSKD